MPLLIKVPRNRTVLRSVGRYPSTLNLLSRKQTAVQRQVRREGLAGYEPVTQATLLTLVQLARPRAHFFDVGAHIGLYSALVAAIYGRLGTQVTAFEPTPDVAATCARIARENDLFFRLEQMAISDKDGDATFYLSDKTESSNSLEAGFKRSSTQITVPITTLDSYCNRTGSHPDVMKIDVETHEAKVLAGAVGVIKRCRPWIVCELLGKANPNATIAALQSLASLGYLMHRWEGTGWLPTPVEDVLAHTSRASRDWLIAPAPLTAEFQRALMRWQQAILSCNSHTNKLVEPGQSPARRRLRHYRSATYWHQPSLRYQDRDQDD